MPKINKSFISWLEDNNDLLHGYPIQEVIKRLSYASFIGKNNNYVFIETPKAACSTLKRVLIDLDGYEIAYSQRGIESSTVMCVHDRAINPIKNISKCNSETIENLFKNPGVVRFCVVRNPYARIVSAWADKVRQKEPGYSIMWQKIASYFGYSPSVSPSFANFVKFITDIEKVNNCNIHWRGMTYLLLPDLIKYTHILHTESLSADLAQVFNVISPDLDSEIILKKFKTNECLPVNWRDYYDEEIANRVAGFYKEDFQQFGYSLDSWKKDKQQSVETVEFFKQRLIELETIALEAIRNRNDAIFDLSHRNKRNTDVTTRNVLVLGDSHISVFKKTKWQKLTPRLNWDVVSVEGATLSGLENPKSKTQAGGIFQWAIVSKPAKVIVFLLGEVDTGFVIWYRAERDGIDKRVAAQKALKNYQNLIKKAQAKSSVIVISAPLPTLSDNVAIGKTADARKLVKASQIERTELTCWFNQNMEQWCINSDISYINLDCFSMGKDGLVDKKLIHPNPHDHHYNPTEYMALLEKNLLPVVRQLIHS